MNEGKLMFFVSCPGYEQKFGIISETLKSAQAEIESGTIKGGIYKPSFSI